MPGEAVTVGILNYNGIDTLERTVASVKALEYRNIRRIMVVDNCSSDGSPEKIREKHPDVHVVRLGTNTGSASARNRILEESKTNLVLMLDNDISLTPGCLAELVRIKKKVPPAGVVHPELSDEDNPLLPQAYNGGWIHYICAFIPGDGYGRKREERADYEIFDTVSGGAILVDRRIAAQTGNFDGDYFFNWEDGDFTFRLTASGYFCVNAPGARAFHKSGDRGKSMVFYQVRNRWYFIIKIYSLRTILLCAPAFALYEVSLAALAGIKGAFRDYARGNLNAVLDLYRTLEKRKKVQERKVRKDSEILRAGNIYVPGAMLGGGIFKAAKTVFDRIFSAYWLAIRRFVQ